MSAIYKSTIHASEQQNIQHFPLRKYIMVRPVKTSIQKYVGNPCYSNEALAAVTKSQ